jgi:4-amino-4-deoxy-L-arabinose transferase-like glycosyltransferase
VPAREEELPDVSSLGVSIRRDRVGSALILVAAALRLVLWSQQRSFWIDEARLSLNIASRSYFDLLPPLDYDQTAPLLYLWLQRSAIVIGGVNELSLRLLAVVAGITTVALVYHLAASLFGRRVAQLSSAIAAVSPTMIYFSSEAKQYGVEACVSCAIVYLGVRCLEHPSNSHRWRLLIAFGVVGIWLASPAVFVLVGAGLAVVLTPKLRTRKRVHLATLMGGCWCISLVLAYLWVYGPAAHETYLRHYWSQAFLTLSRPDALLGAGVAFSSVLLAPVVRDRMVGSSNLGNVVFVPALVGLIALILVIGVRRLAKATGAPGSALVLTPPILVVLASVGHLYPLSARTTTFYLPMFIVLAAAGVEEVAFRVHPRALSYAVMVASCVPLAWVSFRELSDRDPREHLRPLVAALREHRGEGEPVYVFAGAIPAWAMYTTDWESPDTARLDYLRRIARAGGPAFENAPSRGRPVAREGDNLTYATPGGVELYGIPDGLEARVFGLTNALPDTGWAENEARRIREVAHPGAWIILSHFYGPEGQLLGALEARGGRLTYRDIRNGAVLLRYEFTLPAGAASEGPGAARRRPAAENIKASWSLQR